MTVQLRKFLPRNIRMGVPLPILCFIFVVDGFCRAMLNAGEALLTMMFKEWFPVLTQIDIVYRADFFADAALHTGVRYAEVFIQMRGKVHQALIGKLLERFYSGIGAIGRFCFNACDNRL